MSGNQILDSMKNADTLLKIGDELVAIEIKSSAVNKGKSFDKVIRELKKASKEDLFIHRDYASP